MNDDTRGVDHGLGSGAPLACSLLCHLNSYVVDAGRIISTADVFACSVDLLTDEIHQPITLVEDGQTLKLTGGHDAFDAG